MSSKKKQKKIKKILLVKAEKKRLNRSKILNKSIDSLRKVRPAEQCRLHAVLLFCSKKIYVSLYINVVYNKPAPAQRVHVNK